MLGHGAVRCAGLLGPNPVGGGALRTVGAGIEHPPHPREASVRLQPDPAWVPEGNFFMGSFMGTVFDFPPGILCVGDLIPMRDQLV